LWRVGTVRGELASVDAEDESGLALLHVRDSVGALNVVLLTVALLVESVRLSAAVEGRRQRSRFLLDGGHWSDDRDCDRGRRLLLLRLLAVRLLLLLRLEQVASVALQECRDDRVRRRWCWRSLSASVGELARLGVRVEERSRRTGELMS